jgi:hypothetical protein
MSARVAGESDTGEPAEADAGRETEPPGPGWLRVPWEHFEGGISRYADPDLGAGQVLWGLVTVNLSVLVTGLFLAWIFGDRLPALVGAALFLGVRVSLLGLEFFRTLHAGLRLRAVVVGATGLAVALLTIPVFFHFEAAHFAAAQEFRRALEPRQEAERPPEAPPLPFSPGKARFEEAREALFLAGGRTCRDLLSGAYRPEGSAESVLVAGTVRKVTRTKPDGIPLEVSDIELRCEGAERSIFFSTLDPDPRFLEGAVVAMAGSFRDFEGRASLTGHLLAPEPTDHRHWDLWVEHFQGR